MLFPGSKGIGPVAVGSVTHYQTLIYKPIQVFLGLRCAEVDILCQLFCPGRLMFVQIAQNRRLFIVGYRRFIVVYRRFIVGYLLYPALVFLGLLVVVYAYEQVSTANFSSYHEIKLHIIFYSKSKHRYVFNRLEFHTVCRLIW